MTVELADGDDARDRRAARWTSARRTPSRSATRRRRGGLARVRPRHRGRAARGRARAARRRSWRSPATCRAAAGLSSSAALEVALALALLAHAGRAEPDRRALARAVLARGERLGRRPDGAARPARRAARRARATPSGSTCARSTSSPCRSSSAAGGWPRSTPGVEHTHAGSGYNERRARVRARPASARRRARCATPTRGRRGRLPEPLDRRVRHVSRRTRAWTGGGRARARRPRRRSARCSTPRTPACATSTRSRSRRWRRTVARCKAAGPPGRGSWAAASAAPCSRSSRPARRPPPDAARGRARARRPPAVRRGLARPRRRCATRALPDARCDVRARATRRLRRRRPRHAADGGHRAGARRPRARGPARARGRGALDRAVVVKLNGGLGTSMGIPRQGADRGARRACLPRPHRPPGARAARAPRRAPAARAHGLLPHARRHAGGAGPPRGPRGRPPARLPPAPEPKLRADDLEPVAWPEDPALEWCPPGHGDLYPALATSGMLDALRERGFRYAFLANADNLGAVLDPRILAWFAAERRAVPMEVVRGHRGRPQGRPPRPAPRRRPARPARDGADAGRGRRLVPRLRALALLQLEQPLGRPRTRWRRCSTSAAARSDLPLIVNRKTVDPRDPRAPRSSSSRRRWGRRCPCSTAPARCCVPRSRFAPVKTTDDLLVLRSDVYELAEDGRVAAARRGAVRRARPRGTTGASTTSRRASRPGRRRWRAVRASWCTATCASARGVVGPRRGRAARPGRGARRRQALTRRVSDAAAGAARRA